MMKNNVLSVMGKIYFFNLCFLVLCVTAVQAGEYYVSARPTAALNQTDEGDAAWNNASNISTPCSAETAMVHAVAGDTVYFREGTYYLSHGGGAFWWYNGALNPTNSGTADNPITFMAYSGEKPVMDVSTAESGWDNGVAFGVHCQNYITYDGFKVIADGGTKMGAVKIQGNECSSNVLGSVIKNFEFDGGTISISHTDNREGLRVERTTGTVVENSLFYNFRQIDDWHNTSALKFYHNIDLTINNNEVYNSSCGIFLKSDNNNVEVYNNYVHDNHTGGNVPIYNDMSSDDISIYNNIFANNSFASFSVDSEETTAHAYNMIIYNNTYYNSPRGVSYGYSESGGNVGAKIYNNIFFNISETIAGKGDASNINQADHNQLGSPFKIITHLYGSQQGTYTSLSSWQSSGELEGGGNPGVGSLASDPLFLNSSGKMNQLDDFRLAANSPCKGAGRDGVDMGADIDSVGIEMQGGGAIPPPPQKPLPVQDFKRL